MIELRKITVTAGNFQREDISFRVEGGQYAVLMGKTGCGKTTVLESICGLRRVKSGSVYLQEHDVTQWSPADRCVGYVPQDLALFPSKSVREHLEFAMRLRGWKKAEMANRVQQVAERLDIQSLLDRRIAGLSGGESQRVALGRALSFQPRVLMLDEPLSALDTATRQSLQLLLKEINMNMKVTVLHVTHNEDEAESLADQIIRLQ